MFEHPTESNRDPTVNCCQAELWNKHILSVITESIEYQHTSIRNSGPLSFPLNFMINISETSVGDGVEEILLKNISKQLDKGT